MLSHCMLACDWPCSSLLSHSIIVLGKICLHLYLASVSAFFVTGATQSPHIQLPYINCKHNESLWHYQDVGLFTHSNERLGGRDIMSLDYCFPAFVTAQHTASRVLYTPDTMLSGTLLPIWWQSKKTHTEEGWKLVMHKVHIKSQKHEQILQTAFSGFLFNYHYIFLTLFLSIQITFTIRKKNVF